MDFLKKKEGEEFLVSNVFNIPVVNILWNMVASKRFSLSDPRYCTLAKYNSSGSRFNTPVGNILWNMVASKRFSLR